MGPSGKIRRTSHGVLLPPLFFQTAPHFSLFARGHPHLSSLGNLRVYYPKTPPKPNVPQTFFGCFRLSPPSFSLSCPLFFFFNNPRLRLVFWSFNLPSFSHADGFCSFFSLPIRFYRQAFKAPWRHPPHSKFLPLLLQLSHWAAFFFVPIASLLAPRSFGFQGLKFMGSSFSALFFF